MDKYSKIYTVEGSSFRYNYDECLLEYLSLEEYDFNENDELVATKLDEPEVIDAIGLSLADWKESPEYWLGRYKDNLAEEMSYLMADFNRGLEA